MAYFKRDYWEMFLGVIRKYMQVRGPMSQKDLAELTGVGDSTISRFLNQKTRELDPKLIATIVTKLNIPLHEIIDFVEEDYGDRFKKLVKYCKEVEGWEPGMNLGDHSLEGERFEKSDPLPQSPTHPDDHKNTHFEKDFKERRVGENSEGMNAASSMPIKEKLESLSPRQKAYLSDFLNLDFEGRDLVVDVGHSLLRYFKQKGVEL